MIAVIVSLLILISCCAIIVRIIAKRWHALVSIDVDMIPRERDAKVKKKIISERLQRNMAIFKSKILHASAPLKEAASARFGSLNAKIHDIREAQYQKKLAHAKKGVEENNLSPIEKLLSQADNYLEKGEYEHAERRYIDAIALDVKNLKPYDGLAELYIKEHEWEQACEVLEYLCAQLRESMNGEFPDGSKKAALEMRLAENLEELSDVMRELDRIPQACIACEEAVTLQPQNPKFLDAMLELYIIGGMKKKAREIFHRLKEANPDNQKIQDFEERISRMD